jgi:hypothetical protein
MSVELLAVAVAELRTEHKALHRAVVAELQRVRGCCGAATASRLRGLLSRHFHEERVSATRVAARLHSVGSGEALRVLQLHRLRVQCGMLRASVAALRAVGDEGGDNDDIVDGDAPRDCDTDRKRQRVCAAPSASSAAATTASAAAVDGGSGSSGVRAMPATGDGGACEGVVGDPVTADPVMAVLQAMPKGRAQFAHLEERRRPNFSPAIVQALREAFARGAYPTAEAKASLAASTGLTVEQVSNWFINARGRRKASARV